MHVVLLLATLVPQWPAAAQALSPAQANPAPAQAEDRSEALQTAIPCTPLAGRRIYLPVLVRTAAGQDAAPPPAAQVPSAANPAADMPDCEITLAEE